LRHNVCRCFMQCLSIIIYVLMQHKFCCVRLIDRNWRRRVTTTRWVALDVPTQHKFCCVHLIGQSWRTRETIRITSTHLNESGPTLCPHSLPIYTSVRSCEQVKEEEGSNNLVSKERFVCTISTTTPPPLLPYSFSWNGRYMVPVGGCGNLSVSRLSLFFSLSLHRFLC
jgi:hypothetical protein